jgi:branched-chain amino acid transport system substrate-binding protein
VTRLVLSVALAAGLLACGCGRDETAGGGRVSGEVLTVVSLLPLTGPDGPAARDMVRGEKLALAQARGRAGPYTITFSSLDEGGAEPERAREDAAAATRSALGDAQAVAVIGPLRHEAAEVAVPLLNEAGILQVSPGAGYAGFTESVQPGEPERWHPSGRRSFVPFAGGDAQQAQVIVQAARRAAATARPRVLIEREASPDDEALAEAVSAAVSRAGLREVSDPTRADVVVYAGNDLANADGVTEALAREAPGAAVVFGDDLARTELAQRLDGAAARRAVFVSRAPRPGSTPELRRFEAAYRTAYDRAPGPYAALGHAVMASVLRDGIERAGERAGERRRLIDTYLAASRPSWRWSAFRLRDGRPRYLDLGATPAP